MKAARAWSPSGAGPSDAVVEVVGQRRAGGAAPAAVAGGRALGDAVGQVAHHVEALHPLLGEQLDGEALLLGEQRHQQVRAADLVAAGALDLGGGARQEALQGEGQARLERAVGRRRLQLVAQVAVEAVAQAVDVGAGMAQHAGGLVVEGEGVEQVLRAGVLVTPPAGLGDRDGERDLNVLRQFHGQGTTPRFRPLRCSAAVETRRRAPPR